jgi:3-hydroxyisobutyrate dehydrogenase-like beta-hydroxyacid dehydrogenase
MRIGLAAVGEARAELARCLHLSKGDVTVWVPDGEAAYEGAPVVRTVKDLSQRSDIIITRIPHDQNLVEFYRGKEGLLVHGGNKLFVEMSPVSLLTKSLIRKTAQFIGARFVDYCSGGITGGGEQISLTLATIDPRRRRLGTSALSLEELQQLDYLYHNECLPEREPIQAILTRSIDRPSG